MPSVGTLEVYRLPEGEGIRVDNGFEEGMDVPIYYDPMLAKLITYANTRQEALQLMLKAISDYKVEGIETTLPFGTYVCQHEAFISGNFDTHFVKNHYSKERIHKQHEQEAEMAAIVALQQYLEDKKLLKLPN